MVLSKKQLEKVLEAIRKHFNGFVFEAIGERALSPSEISQLQGLGLLKDSVRNMIADPVAVGRLVALIPPARRASLSLEEALRAAKKVTPQTAVETKAIEFAQEHAGTYITGIRDMVLRDTTAASSRASGAALRAVRQGVSEAIANRETVGQLKTRLFDLIDNRSKDWRRVAHTEINTALQQGIHSQIMAQGGGEQLVYKRPAPDACTHCKRVYLKPDGMPRVFRLSQLADTNVGLKAADWEPTIGSVHPWCFTDGRTEVFTSSGWRPIKTLSVGDLVLAHTGIFRRITWIMPSRKYAGGIVEFRVSDAGKITKRKTRMRVTEDHQFLTSDGWVKAKDLRGHKIKCLSRQCDQCGVSFVAYNESRRFCTKACASVQKIKSCHTEDVRMRIGKTLKKRYEYSDFEIVDFKHYDGTSAGLYDFEVEVDHSFVARGIVSHNCGCQLHVVPDGYSFRRTMIVKENFEFDGVSYKIGQVIPEEQFKRFGPEQQAKIGFDPVLTFTGETEAPEVEKSFRVQHVSDNCFCEHD